MGAADAADDSVRLSLLAPGVATGPIFAGRTRARNRRRGVIATSLDKRAMRDKAVMLNTLVGRGQSEKAPGNGYAPSERPLTGPPRTAPHFIASAIMRRR